MAFMEAASEKRGRGRPPKFPPEAYPQGPGAPLTHRGKQDRIYAPVARHLIRERYADDMTNAPKVRHRCS